MTAQSERADVAVESPSDRYRRLLVKRIVRVITATSRIGDAYYISQMLVQHGFPPLPEVTEVRLLARRASPMAWQSPTIRNSYATFVEEGQQCACPATKRRREEVISIYFGSDTRDFSNVEFRCDLEGCVNKSQ